MVRLHLHSGGNIIAAMNLTRIRKLRGLNQQQLAEMVGVDQSTIQRAETMHQSAKLATYRMCAEALGVTLPELFSDDRAAAEAELIRLFREIPEEKHPDLLRLLALAKDVRKKSDQ